MNLRPLDPQSSALPTAPHPDKSYAFLLPEYIIIIRGILQALNYIFYFKSDYLFFFRIIKIITAAIITRANETISDMISALRLLEECFTGVPAEVSSGNTLLMSSAIDSGEKYESLLGKSVLSLTESVFLPSATTVVSTLFLSDKALNEIAGETDFSLATRDEFTSYSLYSDTEKSDNVTLSPLDKT